MSSTNPPVLFSNDTSDQTCGFVEMFQWRRRFLTPETHINFILAICFNVLACPISISINAMVVYIIFANEPLRNIPSNLVFVLMSVKDLGSSIIAQPLFLASISCRISGRCNTCLVDLARNISLIFFTILSVFYLVFMALDRLISIRNPYLYPGIATTRSIAIAAILSCVIAFFAVLIPFVSTDDTVMEDVGRAVIILSVIAATLIIIFYVLIYRESRRHQFAIQAQLNVAFQESQKIAFKAAKTTFLITCTVGISYFMNGVANAVSGWFFLNNKETNSTQFFAFECWSLTLILLNSLFNPLIYTVRSENIAKRLKKLLHFNGRNDAVQEV